MKLFVDDKRNPPDASWAVARTYNAAMQVIMASLDRLEVLSLDHDLGGNKTGYDILCEIERRVCMGLRKIPTITIHTSNPVGRARMEQTVKSIRFRVEGKCPQCGRDEHDCWCGGTMPPDRRESFED